MKQVTPMSKIVIVIPTYNERENTEKMIDALAEISSKIGSHRLEVLYVDGNSPDGTSDVIREKQKSYPWLHLIVEVKKEGLGRAYAKGMTYAMKYLHADYIMEFDADFQHRPLDIPAVVAAIDEGYDYVIGSRYIRGGSIPKGWGFKRKFLSVVGNLVARTLLVLPRVHDVTTGFKLARVQGFMDKFDFDTLLSNRFAYKVHLLYYMIQSGAKVKEVPIVFEPRVSGESKIIKNEMQETLRVIFLLQYHNDRLRRFFKFGVVGFVGYLVNAFFLFMFAKLRLPEALIWAGATEMAVVNNFTLNNLWSFNHRRIRGKRSLLRKFFHFNLTSLGAIAIQTAAGTLAVYMFGADCRQIALPIIILFLVMPYNYFMYTRLIWKKRGEMVVVG